MKINIPTSFEESSPIFKVKTFTKNFNDEFHRVILIDKSIAPTTIKFNKSHTIVIVQNVTLAELSNKLVDLLQTLEVVAKGKVFLIRFACGLSTIIKRYRCNVDNHKGNPPCCKPSFFLPKEITRPQSILKTMMKTLDEKFFKATLIPTSILPLNIEELHDEIITDHFSCCLKGPNKSTYEDFVSDNEQLKMMQQVLNNSITVFNNAVADICKSYDLLELKWASGDENIFSESQKHRQQFYNTKLEELLHLDGFTALKQKEILHHHPLYIKQHKKFQVDSTGTIEFGMEDCSFEHNANGDKNLNSNYIDPLIKKCISETTSKSTSTKSTTNKELETSNNCLNNDSIFILDTTGETNTTIDTECNDDKVITRERNDSITILDSTDENITDVKLSNVNSNATAKFTKSTESTNKIINLINNSSSEVDHLIDGSNIENLSVTICHNKRTSKLSQNENTKPKPCKSNHNVITNSDSSILFGDDERTDNIECIGETKQLQKNFLSLKQISKKNHFRKFKKKSSVVNIKKKKVQRPKCKDGFISLSSVNDSDSSVSFSDASFTDSQVIQASNDSSLSYKHLFKEFTLKKYNRRKKNRAHTCVLLSDERLLKMKEVFEAVSNNYPVTHLMTISDSNTPLEHQLSTALHTLNNMRMRRTSWKKSNILVVSIGTNEIKRKVSQMKEEELSGEVILKIAEDILHLIKGFIESVMSLSNNDYFIISTLPYIGSKQFDLVISVLNAYINTGSINKCRVVDMVGSIQNDRKTYLNMSNYIIEKNVLSAWIEKCFSHYNLLSPMVSQKGKRRIKIKRSSVLFHEDYGEESYNNSNTRSCKRTKLSLTNDSDSEDDTFDPKYFKADKDNKLLIGSSEPSCSFKEPISSSYTTNNNNTIHMKNEQSEQTKIIMLDPTPDSTQSIKNKSTNFDQSTKTNTSTISKTPDIALIDSVNIVQNNINQTYDRNLSNISSESFDSNTETLNEMAETYKQICKKEMSSSTVDEVTASISCSKSEDPLVPATSSETNTEPPPIVTLYDAFAQLVSINFQLMGQITQNGRGLMAIWRTIWSGNASDKQTLNKYSNVQIEFITKVIESAEKWLQKKSKSTVLSQEDRTKLVDAVSIVKKHL